MKFYKMQNIILMLVMALFLGGCGDDSSSPSEPPIALSVPTPSVRTISISDPLDTSSGIDVTKIEIYPEGNNIRLTISFFGSSLELNNLKLYLYGTNREKIDFASNDFVLKRDNNIDGLFEETLFSGPLEFPSSGTVSFTLKQNIFPDLYMKQVWLYSMVNQESVPDLGTINLGVYPEESFKTFNALGGQNPLQILDLVELRVSLNDDIVIFTTKYANPILQSYIPQTIYLDSGNSSQFITLNFMRNSQLCNDSDQDGMSSELLFSAGANMKSSNELEIQIPRKYLPAITSKKIFVISSGDRLPDSDFMILQ